jgi:hypothetical protein
MEMVEGGTRAEVASVLSEKLPEETGRGALSGRDSGSTFTASPFIHAPSGKGSRVGQTSTQERSLMSMQGSAMM